MEIMARRDAAEHRDLPHDAPVRSLSERWGVERVAGAGTRIRAQARPAR
jgi:hypothetical protein